MFRMTKPSQNSPCPCGSGKKYKRCCGAIKSGNTIYQPLNALQKTRQLLENALAHQHRGELAIAAKLYDQLLALHPVDSAFLGLRGMVAFEQRQLDEAEQWLNRAIRSGPDDARLHNFLGQIQVERQEYIAAERAFAKAVTLDPNFFEGWCNLGICLYKSQQLHEAISAYQKALSLSPHDGKIYLNLVEAYYLLGELAKARAALTQAHLLMGLSLPVTMWQALLLRAEGGVEASQAAESQAQLLANSHEEMADWLTKLAQLDVLVGKMEQADYWLTKAIDLSPRHPAPYVELAKAKKFRDSDRALLEKMEALLQAPGTEVRAMYFALGKAYNDLAEYERSFGFYRLGNQVAAQSNRFDADALIAEVSRLLETFSKERMAAFPHGSDSDLPILIVGTPRSGTTLTEQIVSSHSQVEGAGELVFWDRVGKKIGVNMQHLYNNEVAKTLAEGYLSILRGHSKVGRRVTDKMPGNFSHIGLIHTVFPKAKIIHCRRHPIDACLSMYFQDFGDNQEFIFSLERLVIYYEQYLRLMEHWRAVLPPGTMYELQYENLVEDTEGETRKLMAFLDIEWEEEQMGFFKKERPVFTNSMWQVRQPIYKTSKERWRRYEKFIAPLLPLLKYAPDA